MVGGTGNPSSAVSWFVLAVVLGVHKLSGATDHRLLCRQSSPRSPSPLSTAFRVPFTHFCLPSLFFNSFHPSLE